MPNNEPTIFYYPVTLTTVSNVSVYTEFASFTIPANTLATGDFFEMRIVGAAYSTSSSPNVNIAAWIGSTSARLSKASTWNIHTGDDTDVMIITSMAYTNTPAGDLLISIDPSSSFGDLPGTNPSQGVDLSDVTVANTVSFRIKWNAASPDNRLTPYAAVAWHLSNRIPERAVDP